MTTSRSSEKVRIAVCIGVLGLVLRVAYVLTSRHGYRLFGDPTDFDRCAWSLAQGHGYCTSLFAAPGSASAFRPPGYPFLLAAVYSVFGHSLTAARLLACVLGGGTAALAALLALAVTERRAVAWLAGVLVAIAPSLIAISGSLLSENLFCPLALAVALLLLRLDQRPDLRLWALVGVLCGIATLTRTVGVLLILAAMWPLVRSPGDRRAKRRRAAVLVAAMIAAVTPWAVRDALVFGRFIPLTTQGGYTMVTSYNRYDEAHGIFGGSEPNLMPEFLPLLYHHGISEAEINQRETSEALSVIFHHPWFDARVTFYHLFPLFYLRPAPALDGIADNEMSVAHWLRGLLAPSVVVLLILALLGAATMALARLRGRWVLYAVPMLCLLGVLPLLESPRYRVPLDPFVCILAAYAIVRSASVVSGAAPRRFGVPMPRSAGQE
jgi:4-amino-4-deoxy-L-arabinose transferase-like glycosyltransferase